MPNFLIIGVSKSGTTSIYHYLKQHPQIYMSPVKEPGFFAFAKNQPAFCGPGAELFRSRMVVQMEDYKALFQSVCKETAFGEASPFYLSSYQPNETAENIRYYIPHVRLIAILRQPADRAYSHFTFNRQNNIEPATSFTQALAEEPARIRAAWRPGSRYRLDGFYYANIKPYFERFPREQIRVYLHDDWLNNPRQVLRDIFGFLGVDNTFMPDTTKRHNVTLIPRSFAAQRFLTRPYLVKFLLKPLLPQPLRLSMISGLKSLNQTKPPPLDPEIRRQLTEEYREDILKLQDLIGRDLSHWLKT